ncbi:NUDIX hydrolase [Runella sp. SP2]|uniref:NUDIX hydrolase n=1 Tax=Runella sp. SP2 TaxID=2268026 RepID=UPI000F07C643|nr:NUDIX domain-containing protein [Runella sp. SP2]AYQ31183.1 NUDIX domain-containing protein [Runella sp. SP2]
MIQKVSVSGIVEYEQKILLVQRSLQQEFLPGYFEFPGGKVDFGEHPEESVVRELKEETGLSVKPSHIFTCRSYLSKQGYQHNVELFYIVNMTNSISEVILSNEHQAYMWVDKDNLEMVNLPDSDPVKKILEEVLSLYQASS